METVCCLMVFVWLPWGLITTQNIISLKAQYRIWIRSRLTDTRSAENDWIGADTDLQYRIDASLVSAQNFHFGASLPFTVTTCSFKGSHTHQYAERHLRGFIFQITFIFMLLKMC